MTRVSENSATDSLRFAINKTKSKMEELQLKGATLKSITKPSDNPISNVEAMVITSTANDNNQFLKNSNFALMNLNVTEKALEELTDILTKAKEIGIAQSSDFYNADIRRNVASEVQQLYNQTLAIANKKIGLKNIFAGTKTLTVPFDETGKYHGNSEHVNLEVAHNFFVQTNLTGDEIFLIDPPIKDNSKIIEKVKNSNISEEDFNRDLSTVDKASNLDRNAFTNNENEFKEHNNIFGQLQGLVTALETNDPKLIQGLLEKFDNSISKLITLRTRVGSIINSIELSNSGIEVENINNSSRKSNLLDADVAELFSDINKQQAILRTTYQTTQGALSQTLLDFIKR